MAIIKIRHLKEAFATLVAEVGSLVVVLFPNFDKNEVFFLYFFVFFLCPSEKHMGFCFNVFCLFLVV